MLKVQNLSISIKDSKQQKIIVDNISFEIEKSEIFALIGESGSGKTMTALAVMRLLANNMHYAKSSSIVLDQIDILDVTEDQVRNIRGRDIAMIFQDPQSSLNPVLSIGYQIAESVKLHTNLNTNQIKYRVVELLQKVKIKDPETTYSSYPHELSGGMKQRIMIAMALAGNPKLLIADEPTTALDVTTQAEIISLLKTLQQESGMSILFITHDLALAAQIADHIAVMRNGKLIELQKSKKFFKEPQHEYSIKLLNSLPNPDKLVLNKIKQDIILRVQNLKIYFPVRKGILRKTVDYVKAVDDVSMQLKCGETLAIVGESGSGKTTLGRAIVSLVKPTDGRILTELKTQIVFQDSLAAMNPKMRITDIISEADPTIEQNLIDNLLIQVGLDDSFKYRYPHELSGGQRQRACIARVLAAKPDIIVCDEPTSSLDVSVQAQIVDLLLSLQNKLQLSFLFITHNMALVESFAHNTAVMYQGKIVEYSSTAELFANPQHQYTKKLLAAIPKIPKY